MDTYTVSPLDRNWCRQKAECGRSVSGWRAADPAVTDPLRQSRQVVAGAVRGPLQGLPDDPIGGYLGAEQARRDLGHHPALLFDGARAGHGGGRVHTLQVRRLTSIALLQLT